MSVKVHAVAGLRKKGGIVEAFSIRIYFLACERGGVRTIFSAYTVIDMATDGI